MSSKFTFHVFRVCFWLATGALLFLAAFSIPARAQDIQWIRQFGSADTDWAVGVAVNATGIYVGGFTNGTLPEQTSASPGFLDAFVRKHDNTGTEQWTRQFGSYGEELTTGVSVDATGIYVVGFTNGTLPGEGRFGRIDAFVHKYDANGNVLWTRQFGTTASDAARGVASDTTGVYVVGETEGTFPGHTNSGGSDAFVRKYDANGNEQWTRQFGSPYHDVAHDVAVDPTGVYVLGETYGALPGQTLTGLTDAFVRKYDESGNEQWTRQFGPARISDGQGVAVDATGIYAVGDTESILPGQVSAGGIDAFVRKYDASGSEKWTLQFGSANDDAAAGVAVDANGVYVVGITRGTLPGQTHSGGDDAFLLKLAVTSAPTPPAISEGGVVNNASYTFASLALAPGMIAAVFGTNLTDGTSCVPPSCFPSFEGGKLKTTMAGATVTVNGTPAPMFYAIPSQLGVQIPYELSGTSVSVAVAVGAQSSAPRSIPLEPFSPGFFTVSQNGQGAGAITHADGAVVNSQNPARPNEVVILYATGLGQVTPLVPTGTLPTGRADTVTLPSVTVDGIPAEVQFSGLSGCCVGLNQLNVRIPASTRSGSDIPLVLTIGGKQSNPVTIAVAP
ncbi:MAG: hypothetical protein HY647_02145 [Acidobacteria bacterium]|nr:hypothetical protein [Acidobacteriota bacterium]